MEYLNIEKFRKIYSDWRASGQSIKTFTSLIGMAPSTFSYWKGKLQKSMDLDASKSGSFMRLEGSCQPFTSVSPRRLMSPALCEIVYPNGVIVRVTSDLSVEDLRSLISLSR